MFNFLNMCPPSLENPSLIGVFLLEYYRPVAVMLGIFNIFFYGAVLFCTSLNPWIIYLFI